jgi:hypothetical protein
MELRQFKIAMRIVHRHLASIAQCDGKKINPRASTSVEYPSKLQGI